MISNSQQQSMKKTENNKQHKVQAIIYNNKRKISKLKKKKICTV